MTDLGCALRADSLAAAQGDEQPAAVAAVQDGAPHLRGPLEPRRGQGPYRACIPHRGAEDHQEGALLWGTYFCHVVLHWHVFRGKPNMDGPILDPMDPQAPARLCGQRTVCLLFKTSVFLGSGMQASPVVVRDARVKPACLVGASRSQQGRRWAGQADFCTLGLSVLI